MASGSGDRLAKAPLLYHGEKSGEYSGLWWSPNSCVLVILGFKETLFTGSDRLRLVRHGQSSYRKQKGYKPRSGDPSGNSQALRVVDRIFDSGECVRGTGSGRTRQMTGVRGRCTGFPNNSDRCTWNAEIWPLCNVLLINPTWLWSIGQGCNTKHRLREINEISGSGYMVHKTNKFRFCAVSK